MTRGLVGISILLGIILIFTIEYKFNKVFYTAHRETQPNILAAFTNEKLNIMNIEISNQISSNEMLDYKILEKYVLSRVYNFNNFEANKILYSLSNFDSKISRYEGY